MIKISKSAALISKNTASPVIQQLLTAMVGTTKGKTVREMPEIMEDGGFPTQVKLLIQIFSGVKSLAGVGFDENVAPDGLIGNSFQLCVSYHI